MSKENKAIFLDRDGVLAHDSGYLREKSKIKLLPGVESLIKFQKDHLLIIVSNQSVVARGMISEKEMWEFDGYIRGLLKKKGINIIASYYCPHHPDFTGKCSCRKPQPGLFLQAIEELNIDPAESVVIGDKPSDLEAGRKAGVKLGILVRRNQKSWDAKKEELKEIKYKVKNISEAISLILEKTS